MRRLPLLAAMLASIAAAPPPPDTAFTVIGERSLPADLRLDGQLVGGISGLEYDAGHHRWAMISDDKSEHGPAHFYIGRLAFTAHGFDSVTIDTAVMLENPAGRPYPRKGKGGEMADGESIRLDPARHGLVWSSEGDGADGFGPAIRRTDWAGHYRGQQPVPAMFALDPAGRTGPRENLSFEGISRDTAGRGLWVDMEGAMAQDGAVSDTAHGSLARFTLIDAAGRMRVQRAYPLDAVAPHPAGTYGDDGASEILAVDATHLLVLERSGVATADKGFRFRSRLYCASTTGATDTRALPRLVDAAVTPMPKRLLLDLDTLPGVTVDNFEGLGWGPKLPGGRATLVLASDNNFSADHASWFLLLATPGRLDRAWVRRHCPA